MSEKTTTAFVSSGPVCIKYGFSPPEIVALIELLTSIRILRGLTTRVPRVFIAMATETVLTGVEESFTTTKVLPGVMPLTVRVGLEEPE